MNSLFVEIIVYRLKSGSGSDFHQTMLNESLPLHRGAGIRVIASKQSVIEADSYCLIRAFESLATLSDSLAKLYASAAWREGPRQCIVDCILTASSVVLEVPESHAASWNAHDGS
jgi:hypothetical protein